MSDGYADKMERRAHEGETEQKQTGEHLAQSVDPVVQRKESGKAAPQVTSVFQPNAHPNGLPDGLRAGVERLSGLSLHNVRVHHRSPKPAAVNALAYAQGNDIHIGPGQERHLAHEAWHVVQQKQGRVKPTMQLKGVAINDDLGLEREADLMGAKATNGRLDGRGRRQYARNVVAAPAKGFAATSDRASSRVRQNSEDGTSRKSLIDSSLTVSKEDWVMTVLERNGHSKLVIEGIDDMGNYFVHWSHFYPEDAQGLNWIDLSKEAVKGKDKDQESKQINGNRKGKVEQSELGNQRLPEGLWKARTKKSVNMPAESGKNAQDRINELQANPPEYNIFGLNEGKNCADFVIDVTGKAGLGEAFGKVVTSGPANPMTLTLPGTRFQWRVGMAIAGLGILGLARNSGQVRA